MSACALFNGGWPLGFGGAPRCQYPIPHFPCVQADIVRLLWSGLILNAQGLTMAIIGIEANTGILLAQSLSAGATTMVPGYSRGIAAFDVFAQLAGAQTMFSLIIGISMAIQVLRIVTTPFANKVAPA